MSASTVQILSRETVAAWMLKVLQRKGMFAAHAEVVAQRLLDAEHRGRTEHGVMLIGEIVGAIDLGDIDPRARTLTVLDLPAAAILDGSTGAGQIGASEAMQLAIDKSQSTGVGFVVVKNSQPCGDVQVYAELAARAGCIGFCTTSSGMATLPGGDAPVFSTHPEAWAIPAGDDVLVARESLNADKPSLMGYSGIRGLVSLALTAGLTGARAPWQRKKASPYGAGAEHCCLAIHADALAASTMLPTIAAETRQRLGASATGWEAVPAQPLPNRIVLSQEGWSVVKEVAQSARVPWTGE